MIADQTDDELVRHLCHSRGLRREEVAWILQEIHDYYAEERDAFIRRRHRELQGSGLANAAIYRRLAEELAQRRFPAATMSERQIRRIIYG